MGYLGYRFKRSGRQEEQVEERLRKAMGVIASVEEGEEKIFLGERLGEKDEDI